VKAFGKQAEFIEKWCHKGKRVLVIAQPEERSWPDQQGNKRSTIEFQVRAPGTGVTPIDWPDKGQGTDHPAERPQPRQASGGRRHEDDQGPAFPSEASGMDDVPF
jgi:single-strand DNA-binding protein